MSPFVTRRPRGSVDHVLPPKYVRRWDRGSAPALATAEYTRGPLFPRNRLLPDGCCSCRPTLSASVRKGPRMSPTLSVGASTWLSTGRPADTSSSVRAIAESVTRTLASGSTRRHDVKRGCLAAEARWEVPDEGISRVPGRGEQERVEPVRVLIVDDHMAFRKALASALSMVDDVEVAGEAGGGVEACAEAERL